MTALAEFARLETTGLWKSDADAQRIEVIVSFGTASVVLSDSTGNPITHWSLAAIKRISKGTPAIFSVDGHGQETLELDDPTMIRAFDKVLSTLERSRPRPGRLRRWISVAVFLVVVTTLFFWMPGAATRYAASIIPDAKTQEIGAAAFAHLSKQMTGPVCSTALGERSLRKLQDRLIGAPSNRLSVLPMGTRKSALLPGGHILLNKTLLDDDDGPEVLAGYILLERAAQDESPELLDLFASAGTYETLRFLANGRLSDSAIERYAETRLTGPRASPMADTLKDLFLVAELSPAPFIQAEPRYKILAKSDPYREGYTPLLSDSDWLALREICD